jgi:hypothetical protein
MMYRELLHDMAFKRRLPTCKNMQSAEFMKDPFNTKKKRREEKEGASERQWAER